MPKVYLAGPDVFYPDCTSRANHLKKLCHMYGMEGVFPLDAGLDLSQVPRKDQGYRIYEANIKLIQGCDAILANMTPFRGPSMDVGTAFEMGYGAALGKKVVGYTENPSDYKTRVTPDGALIEDFGMVDNLMVHGCTENCIFPEAQDAIRCLAKHFNLGLHGS